MQPIFRDPRISEIILPEWLYVRVVHVKMLILFLLESWISNFWYWGKSGTSFTGIFSRHILAPRNETKTCLLDSLEYRELLLF